jgi:hypothetical protein
MNPAIPTTSPTNGKAKALVDAYPIMLLIAVISKPFYSHYSRNRGTGRRQRAKNAKAAETFVAFVVLRFFVSASPFAMNSDQKISPSADFLQIHFADGVTYKRITLAETLSNESLVRVLDKDKQEGRLDLIQPAFLFYCYFRERIKPFSSSINSETS